MVNDSTGAELLDDVRTAIARYVVLPTREAYVAAALWIAATHGQTAWQHAPRLAPLSPEKRCGKSRFMDCVAEMCHRPLITVNATVAAVFRSIGDDPPTLLVDEADTIFGPKAADNNEELRGLLNAGHQRNRPTLRCVGPMQVPTEFPTFSMAMLAGIGDLPDTIMDRAIIIRMRRRGAGETVAPFRTRRDAPGLHDLRDRLAKWIGEHLDELGDAEPVMPVEDRAADTWEPLVAVADLAGGDWPKLAREAALAFVGRAAEADSDTSLSLRLLADLRIVFGEDRLLHTSTILERLHKIEDAPWADYFGRPFSARDLSKRLAAYEVKPKDVRENGGQNRKGYSADDLWDPWTRYLPPVVRDEGDEGDMPGQSSRGQIPVADTSATGQTSATGLTCEVADVAPVADTCGVCGVPLDPANARAGETTHPTCGEPGVRQ